MPFYFNTLLEDANIKAAEVRLVRHQVRQGVNPTPYDVWHSERARFDAYQGLQLIRQRPHYSRRFWAAFVGLRDGRTMFVGLYEALGRDEVEEDLPCPLTGAVLPGGSYDRYELRLRPELADYAGRLFVEWGAGSAKRARAQLPENRNKPVTEIYGSPLDMPFPGLMELVTSLEALKRAPSAWAEHLTDARGVYFLICPETGKGYVGSATGAGGFWERLTAYAGDGHGGNAGLRARPKGDLQVSILEVAGSAASTDDIVAAEQLWKRKLMTREFGLNQN